MTAAASPAFDPDTLRAARDLGVERVILRLPVVEDAQVLAALDRYADIAARVGT